ncbi:MAG: ABC transporter ATP-binding protein [Planctomycetota bacterium]
MLRLAGICAGYGPLEVLKGINLEVRQGEIVTLLGANGAGKSTTLNTICGLIQTRAGTIEFEEKNISKMLPSEIVGLGISQAPEGRKLFSDMTTRENLEMGAYRRKDRAGIAKDIEKCFDYFPILRERHRQMAGSLSGGEQQMCAIARALMARPKLMLLDEPSLGLAPLLVKQIFEIIEALNKDGTTIFVVEQNARAALRLADRGYIMETGTITMSGAAKELLDNPKVKAAYLGQ